MQLELKKMTCGYGIKYFVYKKITFSGDIFLLKKGINNSKISYQNLLCNQCLLFLSKVFGLSLMNLDNSLPLVISYTLS